jgi:hypothetical protein
MREQAEDVAYRIAHTEYGFLEATMIDWHRWQKEQINAIVGVAGLVGGGRSVAPYVPTLKRGQREAKVLNQAKTTTLGSKLSKYKPFEHWGVRRGKGWKGLNLGKQVKGGAFWAATVYSVYTAAGMAKAAYDNWTPEGRRDRAIKRVSGGNGEVEAYLRRLVNNEEQDD